MSISTVKININGVDYTLTNSGGNNWTATITAPSKTSYNQPDHVFECVATATNAAGTSGTGTANLRVKETVKPVVNIVSPTTGAYVANSKQPVVFTLVDESGGSGVNLASLAVKVDGKAVTGGIASTAITNGYTVTYTPASAMSDGEHTVTVTVSDNDGNAAAAKSTTYTIDTVPPVLNVTSPAAGLITATAACVVSGSTNDTTSSSVTVGIKLNGIFEGNATVTNGSFSKSINLAEGENTIVVTATDSAGKVTTVTRTVTLDTSVPVISSVTIAPNPVDAGASMVVTVVIA